jgi:SAM-dependent methyltransferase
MGEHVRQVNPESSQSAGFEKESARFVSTHIDDYPGAPAWLLQSPALSHLQGGAILDVGCGPATFLTSMVEAFGCASGYGVEPSAQAVELLTKTYAADSRLSFTPGFAHSLPFETGSMDLVVCWSVLHWVGRDEYLQALGELLRVTRKYLVVMDFVAAEDYRVSYHHDARFYTYKMDFDRVLSSSGVLDKVEEHRWWEPEAAGDRRDLTEADLLPFLGNPHSFHARKACIYRKNYSLLPLHIAVDFGG